MKCEEGLRIQLSVEYMPSSYDSLESTPVGEERKEMETWGEGRKEGARDDLLESNQASLESLRLVWQKADIKIITMLFTRIISLSKS